MTRFQKILLALVAMLILVVAVGSGILISQNLADQRHEAYLQCLAIRGFTPENPGTLDELVVAAEECSD